MDSTTLNRSSVVKNRYLRLCVDIKVVSPLPIGFHKKKDMEEIWIQFKWERLADFCYKCGLLTHITGKCSFASPARVTSALDLTAKLYGP